MRCINQLSNRSWFMSKCIAGAGFFLLALSVLSGCGTNNAAQPQKPPPPEVIVATPTSGKYLEHEEFTGRLWPRRSVDIRARVSGYLDKVLFVDGADVAEGAPLFQIDARPYQAEFDRTSALVTQSEARMKRLESQLERSQRLIASNAISKEEYENLVFDRDEARGALQAALAARETAQLNLQFTTVKAPLAGRISRRLVDAGNLIKADDTNLAHLVALNPIDAYFDMDERTVLRLRRMWEESPELNGKETKIKLALADDRQNFNLTGVMEFTDNQLEAGTGTLRLRARVDNDKLLLSPGMFIRCRYPIGEEREATFIPEQAIGSDQGKPFVYVIEKSKDPATGKEIETALYREIKIGPLEKGKRVVREGLKLTDRFVLTGLQRVRPGQAVSTKTEEQVAAERAQKEAQGKENSAASNHGTK
jgi:RND family efflux transporter MFP subunit